MFYITQPYNNVIMNIITFNNYWSKFHDVTNQYKLNKQQARNLWNRTISKELKKKAFYNINKNLKITAYDYLLEQFKIS